MNIILNDNSNLWVGGPAGGGATRFIIDHLAGFGEDYPIVVATARPHVGTEYAHLNVEVVSDLDVLEGGSFEGALVFDGAHDLWELACRTDADGEAVRALLDEMMADRDLHVIVRAQRVVGSGLGFAFERCQLRAVAGVAPRSEHTKVLGTDALHPLCRRPGDVAVADTDGNLAFFARRD